MRYWSPFAVPIQRSQTKLGSQPNYPLSLEKVSM